MRNFLVNPTGRFVIGGPMGDCGLTGRKIIVDTYGGMARHGGGAFSGKDPSKVDRSAAYAARWVAKNIVAAGLADRAEVQVAYAIGVARPVSVMVETFGTEKIGRGPIARARRRALRPAPGRLPRGARLHRPIYQQTAAYGHFGRDDHDFTWEDTDKASRCAPPPGCRRPAAAAARRAAGDRPGGGYCPAPVPAIAQVEPLTTARALRGPFDYRLPERAERRRRRLAARRAVRPPRGPRRRRRAGRASELADERLLAPLRALGSACRPTSSSSPSGSPPSTARRRRARSARAARRAPPRARAARAVARLAAELTPEGERRRARRRAAPDRRPARGARPGCSTARAQPPRRRRPRRAAPPGARGLLRLGPAEVAAPPHPPPRRRPAPTAPRARRATRPRPSTTVARARCRRAAATEFLLHGVTGSGKTEVYLRAAAARSSRAAARSCWCPRSR